MDLTINQIISLINTVVSAVNASANIFRTFTQTDPETFIEWLNLSSTLSGKPVVEGTPAN